MTRNSLCPHFEKIWGFPLGSSTTLKRLHLFLSTSCPLQNEYGSVALHKACAYGHLECAKALLGAGADINKQANYGSTPLIVAAYNGKIQVVEALLNAGADKAVKKENGKTALDLAQQANYPAIVKLLRPRGVFSRILG